MRKDRKRDYDVWNGEELEDVEKKMMMMMKMNYLGYVSEVFVFFLV